MKGLKGIFSIAILCALVVLSACSQGRRSLANQNQDELCNPQDICQNLSGQTLLGCFQIQLDITANEANITVLELGFDPSQVPYRILGERKGDTVFHVLQDNITTAVGGTINLYALQSQYIEQYQTWRVELTTNYDANGLAVQAAPGTGLPVAQVIINWPELAVTNTGTGSSSQITQ